jgi:hypothetical protein
MWHLNTWVHQTAEVSGNAAIIDFNRPHLDDPVAAIRR